MLKKTTMSSGCTRSILSVVQPPKSYSDGFRMCLEMYSVSTSWFPRQLNSVTTTKQEMMKVLGQITFILLDFEPIVLDEAGFGSNINLDGEIYLQDMAP